MTNRLATDNAQAVVWRWEGEAFGNTPAQELAGFSVNLRFPGQYFDEETNLHYNHFRYYDPTIGRYITSDPIGLVGGINTYLYVNANPILSIDLFGLIDDAIPVFSGSLEVGAVGGVSGQIGIFAVTAKLSLASVIGPFSDNPRTSQRLEAGGGLGKFLFVPTVSRSAPGTSLEDLFIAPFEFSLGKKVSSGNISAEVLGDDFIISISGGVGVVPTGSFNLSEFFREFFELTVPIFEGCD